MLKLLLTGLKINLLILGGGEGESLFNKRYGFLKSQGRKIVGLVSEKKIKICIILTPLED